MRGGRLRRRIVLAVLAAVLAPPFAYLAWSRSTYNFAAVREGEVYRSGQMPSGALKDAVGAHRIRTVLNLRGVNEHQAWYRAERAAALGAGATLVDIPMSSCEWMSRAQIRAVVNVLDTQERPILVHCQWGSERTGLVSAFAELLRPGVTLDEARKQISLRYLYVRLGDGKVMAEHVDQYERWLRDNRRGHTPDAFRLWAGREYVPRQPSREFWPSDPSPVVVVTRPGENVSGKTTFRR